ncbi:ABC transporter permease [Bordetella sp. N]|uniref:ABC transporter permease n=1 Tax=Bordetella sp. N TaxID=1746199 RepID=UPI00070A7D7E|nr:ABC transporter permease [Bordetella sp. N]ALM82263.1 hypothetical protein ASB57_04175 [Bordetella sp. N]
MTKLALWIYRLYLTAVLVFLLLPVGMIILNSFSSAGVLQFPPPGFSLRWYENLPLDYVYALRNSIAVGAITTAIATLAGVPAAIGLQRLRLPGIHHLRAVFLAPLMVPTLVIAVAALQFSAKLWDWAGLGLGGSLAGIALAQSAFTTPLVVRAVLAAQAHLDPSLEEAARSLGATPLQAFFRASLPALLPGIAAGAFFAFVISLDDVVVALFVGSGSSQTLPVKIYSAVEFNFDGGLLAISTVIIALSLGLALLFERYVGLSRIAAVTRA